MYNTDPCSTLLVQGKRAPASDVRSPRRFPKSAMVQDHCTDYTLIQCLSTSSMSGLHRVRAFARSRSQKTSSIARSHSNADYRSTILKATPDDVVITVSLPHLCLCVVTHEDHSSRSVLLSPGQRKVAWPVSPRTSFSAPRSKKVSVSAGSPLG